MTGRGEELNSGPPKINAWRPDYMSSLNHCASFASGLHFLESVSRKILA